MRVERSCAIVASIYNSKCLLLVTSIVVDKYKGVPAALQRVDPLPLNPRPYTRRPEVREYPCICNDRGRPNTKPPILTTHNN